MYPEDLRYTDSDEWIRSGDPATVGITYFAQDQLGDVVYLELPKVGRTLKAGEPYGTVESVKATSDLNAPAGGEVVEVNGALEKTPELVNSDPYGEGWIIKLRLSDPAELDALMDAATYERTREAH
jgi:glycine cleavage system H protein